MRTPPPLLLLSLACVGLLAQCHDSDATGPSQWPWTTIELRLQELVNAHRDSLGLAPLAWSETIAAQVRTHSLNMSNGTVAFGHEGFDQRVAVISQAIPSSYWAENVARNYGGTDPAYAALQQWLNSSGHKANMECACNMAAVGVAQASSGEYFFTMFFLNSP